MTLVVNLFGGPGTGKSVCAAETFALLKKQGYDVELVTEYAKEKVYEDAIKLLSNQIYIFANQHQRIDRLIGKVDAIITDSPVNLGLIFGNMYGNKISPQLDSLIRYEFKRHNNLNVFLRRTQPYKTHGRLQTEDEAREIDFKIIEVLEQDHIPYYSADVGEGCTEFVVSKVKERLKYK